MPRLSTRAWAAQLSRGEGYTVALVVVVVLQFARRFRHRRPARDDGGKSAGIPSEELIQCATHTGARERSWTTTSHLPPRLAQFGKGLCVLAYLAKRPA